MLSDIEIMRSQYESSLGKVINYEEVMNKDLLLK